MDFIKLVPYGYALMVAVLAFIFMKRALHMFQQNRYEMVRFIPWLKEQFFNQPFKNALVLLPFLSYALIFVMPSPVWQWVILFGVTLVLMAIFYGVDYKRTYVKPLDVTHRVLRQIFVFYLLLVGVLFVTIKLNHLQVWMGLSMVLVPLVWVLVIIMALITYPIEELVKKGYIVLAKQRLKKQKNLIKVGITGSYGKTTTKHIVNDVLSANYYTLMTPASYNTPMGITITIRNYLKPLHQVFVCEMGADKVNEIRFLSNMV
ncbi:MAG: UDP-N-acetylmuramoyl-tripeptide--D-alanyl-D-alanine ligase, partial [Erysipelothrix sp.]|nr:UDP-N-acetylmuramoyl-tripeptide--D-alanyl-D-alanine ligase [Erysipelothrix sp.]